MNGFGIVFYVAIILLGSNMGIPMGMPPGPEDPLMAQIAPDECVFYASWSGVAKIDPKSNPTEKWMSQPMTSRAIEKLRKAIRGFVLARGETFAPTTRLANRMLVEVIDAGAVEPAAIYVDKLNVENMSVSLQGAVMVSLGEQREIVQRRFDELYDAVVKQQANRESLPASYKAVELDGEKIVELPGPGEDTPIVATIRGKYFILGIGKGSLEAVAKNSKTPPPGWLADMRDRLTVDRIGSVGFASLEAGRDLIKSPILGMGIVGTEDELFSGIKSFGWVSGLDARGFLSRAEVTADKNENRILSFINSKPIPKRFLKNVPADATAGLATRVSTKKILEMVKSTARRAKQEESLNEALQKFQKVTGVSLEHELLDAVGDYVHAYYEFEIPDFNKNWVVSVRIEDEMSFPAIFEQLNRGIKNWIEDMDGYSFKTEKNGLHEIHSVSTPRGRNNFAWGVVDDQWYFAQRPGDIVNHFKSQPLENPLMTDPAVEEAYELGDRLGFGGPVMIVSLNLPDIFNAARPFLNGFNQNDSNIIPEFDFKWTDIPSIDELVEDVRPNFMFVYKTDRGLQFLQRQTYPGSSAPVSAAAFAISALPVHMADMISRRKLQVLGKAHLDFEKEHKRLCAAYSVDANGNHLLSWRVHLLPYLGCGELYKQFHLNEPWDSEHNSRLLDKMPDVYRHPSLNLGQSKTVYQVPTSKGAAFETNLNWKQIQPKGLQLADFKDDPATTAMILELNKIHQVFWTQPLDATCTGNELRVHGRAVRKSNRFGVTMCDGSVRMLYAYTPQQTLENVLNRNDGKKVTLPSYGF